MALDGLSWDLFLLLVTAIAPLFAAILSYLSRPILVRSIENHTKDLKKFTQKWLDVVPGIPDADRVLIGVEQTVPEFKPLRLEIEGELLFDDLKEHMPRGMNLHRSWEDFKTAYDSYNSKRLGLFGDIIRDAEVGTGLKFDERGHHGITVHLAHAIYTDLFRVLYGYEPYFLKTALTKELRGEMFSLWSSNDLAIGTEKEILRAERFMKDTLRRLRDSPYFPKAKRIFEEEDELTRNRQNERLKGYVRPLSSFVEDLRKEVPIERSSLFSGATI